MRKELIAQKNPKSPIAEMFRTLRTNIQFMNSQKDLKSILVTSTMPGEGKSWVSSNLAVTFAQAGKKVILIDADLRKGRLASIFQINSKPGLSNFLSGIDEKGMNENIDILTYVKPTEVENLYLIPTGNIPPKPSELLGTEATVKMIERLKEVFDIVILDGTPSLLVTDALILSRIADTTILVAAHKSTKKEDLQKVKKSIENVGGKIAGVVLNKIPIKAKEYTSSYYYGNNSTSNKSKHAKIERKDVVAESNVSREKQQEILSQLNDYLKNKE